MLIMSFVCCLHVDVLLCHDDELEGRRIAYIFYLVPPDWEADDGGMILFSFKISALICFLLKITASRVKP